jgi:hypothetical protein
MKNNVRTPAEVLPYSRILTVLLVGLGVFLALPVFNSVHLEGFSAQIQSIALALGTFGVSHHDTYQPLLTEFIFLTRQGVSELLLGINTVFGYTGDAGFRSLMIASVITILASGAMFARRWGNVGARLALAAMVLAPGIIESSFFFNDNIVSTAFASLAMAIVIPGAGMLRYGVAGLAYCFALLCRLDAVFALPIIVALAASDSYTLMQFIRRGVAFAAGVLLVGGLMTLMTGATPWDALLIAKTFAAATKGFIKGIRFDSVMYFFGVVTPIMLIIGAWPDVHDFVRRKRFWYPLALAVYPVILIAYAGKNGNEIRYMLPLLAPVIALQGGRGLRWVLDNLKAGRRSRRAASLTILGLLLLTFVLPPFIVKVKDGPRELFGRLYATPIWWKWQGTVHTSMQRLAHTRSQLEAAKQTLVIANHYNDDFYLRLRLFEAGYRDIPIVSAYPGCGGFSVYRRGNSEVLHIRLNNNWQLAPLKQEIVSALMLTKAFACPVINAQQSAILTGFGDDVSALEWKRFDLPVVRLDEIYTKTIITDEVLQAYYNATGQTPPKDVVKTYGLYSTTVMKRDLLDRILSSSHRLVEEESRMKGKTPEQLYQTLHSVVLSKTPVTMLK